MAGSSWAVLTITLANFGEKARSPAYTLVIDLATCMDKETENLSELWEDNIKVLHPLLMLTTTGVCLPVAPCVECVRVQFLTFLRYF